MDIFFSGSIRGGRTDAAVYATLIQTLAEHGRVLTKHVGVEGVEQMEAAAGLTDEEIHDQDVAWLGQADAVVAEVTTPSLGVGYELGRAVEQGTPALALYRPESDHDLSAMVRGAAGIEVSEYRDPEAVTETLVGFVDRHR